MTEIGNKQPTIEDGDLTIANTAGLQTALNGKQATIEDGDLTIANTAGLQTALNGKQPTIEDGDLTIAKTDGLQTALNAKQPTIEDGDLTIANTAGLQTALNGKQATIEDGDLTIARTSGLQTALDNKYDDTGGTIDGDVNITGDLVVDGVIVITEIETKQDTITPTTDLSCNSLNTNQLIVDNSEYFDTIVVRNTNYVGGFMSVVEIQLWINDINRLPLDITLTSINTEGQDLGNTPEYIDWDTKKQKQQKHLVIE